MLIGIKTILHLIIKFIVTIVILIILAYLIHCLFYLFQRNIKIAEDVFPKPQHIENMFEIGFDIPEFDIMFYKDENIPDIEKNLIPMEYDDVKEKLDQFYHALSEDEKEIFNHDFLTQNIIEDENNFYKFYNNDDPGKNIHIVILDKKNFLLYDFSMRKWFYESNYDK